MIHRDVLPEVAVHINHDGIDALEDIEDTSQEVVVRNLCGVLLALQAEVLAYERLPTAFQS